MPDLVPSDVNVVDPRDGSIASHQDVSITSGTISSIGATTVANAESATRGTFVVPGYVDMHAHR